MTSQIVANPLPAAGNARCPYVQEKVERMFVELSSRVDPDDGSGPIAITSLAQHYGVSRKTIRRWLKCLKDDGRIGISQCGPNKPPIITLLTGGPTETAAEWAQDGRPMGIDTEATATLRVGAKRCALPYLPLSLSPQTTGAG